VGNRYLRVLFVQAAWVVLIKPKSWDRHGLKSWLETAADSAKKNNLPDRARRGFVQQQYSIASSARTINVDPLAVCEGCDECIDLIRVESRSVNLADFESPAMSEDGIMAASRRARDLR
jgi:hypothetical protein